MTILTNRLIRMIHAANEAACTVRGDRMAATADPSNGWVEEEHDTLRAPDAALAGQEV